MKFQLAIAIITASLGEGLAFSSLQQPAFSTNGRTTSSLAAVEQMTRFDRLKKSYKGPKIISVDEMIAESDEPEEISFGYEAFDHAVQETDYSFRRNDVVSGTVVQYENGGCIVDIGAKSSAFLPTEEASLFREQGAPIENLVELEKEMNFQIISEEDENGQLLVSVRRIQYREAWETVEAQQGKDEVFEAPVVAVNRGGAICLVEGLRAFLPGSHLTGVMPTEDLIGKVLPLKFLEVDREENKLVVSNRRAVVEQQMSDLNRGDLVQGMVKALKPYGAFVEVGGMSGLLHISQISYDRIENLENVFQPGDQVKCMIIDHDVSNGRIALSTKTLEPEPGDMLKDPARVYAMAEDTAAKYHERMEAERKAREEAAVDIVLGLGDSLTDGLLGGDAGDDDSPGSSETSDALSDVTDELDSLLT